MSNSPSGSGRQRWEVDNAGIISRQLLQIQQRAEREGRGEAVLRAIRLIMRRLQSNPHSLGEQLFRLPALRIQVHFAIVPPLAIHFGICEDRPLVVINGLELLPPPG